VLSPGEQFGRYRIHSAIGEGGMGQVFLAEDLELERRVALKVLPSDVADNKERVARFIQEAKAASALNHPNIITIHEIGTVNEVRFIATEHIDGETLREKIRKRSLTIPATVEVSIQASLALQTAHSQNIIHRDIKPENIMVRHDGLVKVLDFGLAKLTQQKPFDSDSKSPTRVQVMSRSGTILGTVSYMSPEQARGKKVDHRTDIFSLGAVMYEMLTGKKPFPGETSSDVIASILMKEPKSVRALDPGVPEELERIIFKMLSKEPEQRYTDAGSLVHDLRSVKREVHEAEIVDRTGLSYASAGAKTEILVNGSGRAENASTNAIGEKASVRHPPSRLTEKLASAAGAKLTVALVLGVIATAIVTIYWLGSRATAVTPKAEAVALYNSATDALRDGTYYKASKLLEDSIKIDDSFANAHARLAEAWIELDYFGRAEREMLKVRELERSQTGLLTSLFKRNSDLHIDAVSATVLRNLPEAVRVYERLTAADPDDAQGYVDLGRALEKNEEIERAIEAYDRATQLNGQYGAAFLRLGILKSRKGEYENAGSAFDKAESIYERSSNDEGVTEVKFHRGVAFNAQEDLSSALKQFQLVSSSPRANRYQKIQAMLQTSSVLCSVGKTQPAQTLASEAIELAREERMENVATTGLIDLANAFLSREEYTSAETHLRQALDFAHRDDGRRNEARASLALASMFLETHRADDVLEFVRRALPFYEQGGYSREVSQAYVLRGFSSRMKGDLAQAVQSFDKASQMGEASQRALASTGLGTVLTDQEHHPKALQYFEQSNRLYESMGNSYYTAFSKYNVAASRAKLGLIQDAKQALADGEKILVDGNIEQPSLQTKFGLLKAQLALSEGRYKEVPEIVKQIRTSDDPELLSEQYCITALSRSFAKTQNLDAIRSARRSVEIATEAHEAIALNKSKLALAEVYLHTGNYKDALTTALEAKDHFVSAGQKESEWRAWFVAARSADHDGNHELASQYMSSSAAALSDLKKDWGADYFQTYSARADIKSYIEQIKELN